MSVETKAWKTHVFVSGDPNPLGTTLIPEQVVSRMLALWEADRAGELVFICLPLPSGDTARVRPRAISAILPVPEEEED